MAPFAIEARQRFVGKVSLKTFQGPGTLALIAQMVGGFPISPVYPSRMSLTTLVT
jgi:hypothetical protein